MSYWYLLQVLIDVVFLAVLTVFWSRSRRPTQDDPRLSKGLQLLQSKIAILEDLSDRIESQSAKINAHIEAKSKEMQTQIDLAEKQILKIQDSMAKSLEVAKIFQDKIPHQEIVERQNTIKYIKAARMAHQGTPVDEIIKSVDLSRGEIEFIANVNRDGLQFSESNLPDWAKDDGVTNGDDFKIGEVNQAITAPPPQVTLSSLGERIRQATAQDTEGTAEFAKTSSGKTVEIKKVVFPRVKSL